MPAHRPTMTLSDWGWTVAGVITSALAGYVTVGMLFLLYDGSG